MIKQKITNCESRLHYSINTHRKASVSSLTRITKNHLELRKLRHSYVAYLRLRRFSRISDKSPETIQKSDHLRVISIPRRTRWDTIVRHHTWDRKHITYRRNSPVHWTWCPLSPEFLKDCSKMSSFTMPQCFHGLDATLNKKVMKHDKALMSLDCSLGKSDHKRCPFHGELTIASTSIFITHECPQLI